jgi:RNA polymerase sigma factor (sigma-70 family)
VVDADDLAQVGRQAAVKAASTWDESKGKRFESWVYSQVRYRIADAARLERNSHIPTEELWPEFYEPIPEPVSVEDVLALSQAVGRLNAQQRNVVHLHYSEGFSLAEIGRQVNLTRERIRQIHEEALLVLRGILDPTPE